jgi:uncharacterized protein (DUF488 family)
LRFKAEEKNASPRPRKNGRFKYIINSCGISIKNLAARGNPCNGNIMAGDKILHTLGTGSRSAEEFLGLLRAHNLEMVADVRSFPKSRFPHFRREVLAQSLGEAGIGYAYLGKELGGRRPEGFEAYTQTSAYLQGIERLERLASRCRCVVLCAERLPERCHRRFIARSLEERGWQTVHIIDADRTPRGPSLLSS